MEIDVVERANEEKRTAQNYKLPITFFLRENIKKKPTCLAFMTAKQREKNNTVSEKKTIA